jgi:hypothetical protein
MRNESQGPVERDYLEDLSIDGRIILKFILRRWDRRVEAG